MDANFFGQRARYHHDLRKTELILLDDDKMGGQLDTCLQMPRHLKRKTVQYIFNGLNLEVDNVII